MKIAFVSEHASPLATLAGLGGVDAGGQNVHVAELAAALVRRGHEVVVYTRRDAAEVPIRVRTAAGYAVVHLDAGPAAPLPKDDLWPHLPAFADRLRDELTADRPDLVHGHFWMSIWAAQRVAADLDLPSLATFHALGWVKRRHQPGADTSPADRAVVEPRLAAAVDRVVATCADEVAELQAHVDDLAPVSVVPCGVDVDVFTPDGPARSDRWHRHRILTLGRLVPRKGFGTVIAALAQLPATELVLAGGTGTGPEPERQRLLELAEQHGVSDRVLMLPQVSRSDVPALLRSADVVVSVPWYEPFGIVPLEAMACGRPVVGSAVGGLLDSVAPGLTGTLVPPRDADAVAVAVAELLADPDRRELFGRAGAERARRCFSWDRVAAATLEAYGLTLEQRRRAPRSLAASTVGA